MITATLRRSTTPVVTVAPPGTAPATTVAPSQGRRPTTTTTPAVTVAPSGTTSATPAPDVEAQIVEVQGEKIECQNTAAPGLESILPPSTPDAPLPDHPAPLNGAVEVCGPSPVATLRAYESDDDGFDATDDRHPTLRIVAGSGKLSTMFNVGTLILGSTIDDSEALTVPPDPKEKVGKPIRFVPLSLKKFWRENLTDDEVKEGATPRTFKTVAEVEANNGITVWIGRTPPTFKPSATCLMLIQQPEGCESALFQLELDGKLWCPSVYYSGNSAYKTFALPLLNNSKTVLQVPVLDAAGQPRKDERGFIIKERYWPKYVWSLQVKQTIKKLNDRDFTVFVPDIRVQTKEVTGPELRNFVDSFLPKASAHVAEE
jgi:hypothetical protein